MIDIHSHILPGIDDGSKNEDISKKLLELAKLNGTTDIIATPHTLSASNFDRPTWSTIERLAKEIAQEGINIHTGAELEVNWDIQELIKEDSSEYCLANSHYLLAELPSQTIPNYAEEFFYELQMKGKRVIIAHPERHPLLQKDPSILSKWVKKGIFLQCNAGSFAGVFGPDVKEFAKVLLQHDLVHFIGSDAHNLRKRTTDTSIAKAEIIRIAGEAKTKEIFETNPRYILEDKEFSVVEPKVFKVKKKSFLKRLFCK